MQTDLINNNTDLFGFDGARVAVLEAPIALQTATIAGGIRSMLPETSDTQNEYDELSCQDLSNKFGIIAGQSFGTADEKVRNSWIRRGCNTKPSNTASDESAHTPVPKPTPKQAPVKAKPTNDDDSAQRESSDDDEAFESEDSGSDNGDGKIFGMPKGVVIGLGIAVALIGGFLVYKKVIAKK